MWKKKLDISCGLGTQGYLGEIWLRDDVNCSGDDVNFVKVGCITNFNFTINSELQDISTIGQLNRDDNYKKFEVTFKRWSLQINSLYIEDDAGQEKLRQSIDNGQRVWLKLIPRSLYNSSGLRIIHVGAGFLTSVKINNGLQTSVNQSLQIIGTGPLEKMLENSSHPITCENICCVELNETVYVYNVQDFEAPPAPEGSSGWIVEETFFGVTTGTGDIGTYTTHPSGAGLSGCPVQIVYRYLCDDSPFVPDPSDPAILQFVDIVDNTTNDQQIKIIQLMEELAGVRLDGRTVFGSDLWIAFNLVFLPANPDFIFDLSGLGLVDLYVVATLTNLTGLDVNFNNLSFPDLETIQDLELVYLSANHNLLGQWNSVLSAQQSTIKYLDLSFNFITENFLFSTFSGSGSVSLDFYDMSHNIVAFYTNNKLKVKKLLVTNNRYPNDSALGNGFWEAQKGDTNITTELAVQFPQLSEDFSILEELDLSSMELWLGGVPSDDLTALITEIATDLGITVGQAAPIVTYNPTYLDILPIDVFDFLSIERSWLNA